MALDLTQLAAVAAGLGWASGLRLYAVLFLTGAAGWLGWIDLPSGLRLLESPWLLGASGTMLVLGGVVLGVLAAVVLARLASALLYGVGATDPLSLAAASAALLLVGAVAALVPAWRAGRTHPALALREE